jgi:uncharacterized membrane protein YfcA
LPSWNYLWLVPAGIIAGITGSVAGLASLVSYPALLALGLPPVIANVSNTVALVFGGIGAVSASGAELAGQARRMVPLAMATISGGVMGGLLLMIAPAASFAYIVPWLIGGASAAVLLPRRVRPPTPHRFHKASRNLLLGLSNAVASVVFIFYGTVRWLAAIPLAVGFLIGGRMGPVITRKTPAAPLRFVIALAGLGLALDLAWQAYR